MTSLPTVLCSPHSSSPKRHVIFQAFLGRDFSWRRTLLSGHLSLMLSLEQCSLFGLFVCAPFCFTMPLSGLAIIHLLPVPASCAPCPSPHTLFLSQILEEYWSVCCHLPPLWASEWKIGASWVEWLLNTSCVQLRRSSEAWWVWSRWLTCFSGSSLSWLFIYFVVSFLLSHPTPSPLQDMQWQQVISLSQLPRT